MNKGDLISRQAVIDTILPILNTNNDMSLAGNILARIDNIPTAYNVDKVIHKTKCYFIDKLDDADKSDYCRLVSESHTICNIIRNGGKE